MCYLSIKINVEVLLSTLQIIKFGWGFGGQPPLKHKVPFPLFLEKLLYWWYNIVV
jgi:hypothetical protein